MSVIAIHNGYTITPGSWLVVTEGNMLLYTLPILAVIVPAPYCGSHVHSKNMKIKKIKQS